MVRQFHHGGVAGIDFFGHTRPIREGIKMGKKKDFFGPSIGNAILLSPVPSGDSLAIYVDLT